MTTFLGVSALGLTSIPVAAGSWALLGSVAGPALGLLLALLGWRLALRGRGVASEPGRTVLVADPRAAAAARTAATAPLPHDTATELPRPGA